MRGTRWTFLALAAGLLAAPLAASANETQDYGPSGRVSAVEGELYGKGPYDTDTSELSENAVLRQGDQVWTDEGTFAEIELPGGSFLRLAGSSSVTFERLGADGIDIALGQGAAYISRGNGAAPARFVTQAGTVELGGASMVRTSMDPAGVEVSVASGSAELRNDRSAQAVQARSTLQMRGGQPQVVAFDPSRGDAFDQWNADREQKVRNVQAPDHVADNVVGAYELQGNGTWVLIDGYWAWRPTVVADWRPYSDGYWSWCEPWGWTWVDYAPWGYTTCHYGRWYYRGAYGWVWYPDPVWAPAWVVWAAFDVSIGWAPCDFWGRPIYCYSYYSYYDYGSWCYADAGYFWYGGGYHYYDGDYHHGGHHHHDHAVTTTARHEAPNRNGFSRHQIGQGGKFAIHKFDAATMKRVTPVPVRDPVRELTPHNVVALADSGKLRGVSAADRRGDLLNRAAKGGGVKPEPWNRNNSFGGSRNLNEGGLKGQPGVNRGAGNNAAGDRLHTQGWSGRVPDGAANGRPAEGWNGRGAANVGGGNNGMADHFRGASDFSGGGNRGATDYGNTGNVNRGGNDYNRGNTGNFNRGGTDYNPGNTGNFNRGGSSDYNRGNSGNFDRGGSTDTSTNRGNSGNFNRGGSSNPPPARSNPPSQPIRSSPPPSRSSPSPSHSSPPASHSSPPSRGSSGGRKHSSIFGGSGWAGIFGGSSSRGSSSSRSSGSSYGYTSRSSGGSRSSGSSRSSSSGRSYSSHSSGGHVSHSSGGRSGGGFHVRKK